MNFLKNYFFENNKKININIMMRDDNQASKDLNEFILKKILLARSIELKVPTTPVSHINEFIEPHNMDQ